jgi:hypothetical protein
MKPNFTLYLSQSGIKLTGLNDDQSAEVLGEVHLEDPEFGLRLDELRQLAEESSAIGVACEIVIPESEILVTSVHAPGPDQPQRYTQIANALESETPYQAHELSFDWVEVNDRALVVAVANQTLAEAESFAVENGFNPVTFSGASEQTPLARRANFGPTEYARNLPGAFASRVEAQHLAEGLTEAPAPFIGQIPDSQPLQGSSDGPDVQNTSQPIISDDDLGPVAFSVSDGGQDANEVSPEALAATTRFVPIEPIPRARRRKKNQKSLIDFLPAIFGAAGALKARSHLWVRHVRSSVSGLRRISVSTATKKLTAAQGGGDAPAKVYLPHSEGSHKNRNRRLYLIAAALLVAAVGVGAYIWSAQSSNVADVSVPARDLGTNEDARPTNAALVTGNVVELPDTVVEAKSLTTQELDDIVIAGLPLPEELDDQGVVTDELLEALYAESGIWQGLAVPRAPTIPSEFDDLFVAEIDRTILLGDAVALPDFSAGVGDVRPNTFSNPVSKDTKFAFDDQGNILATQSGARTPEGVRVVSGKPRKVPPARVSIQTVEVVTSDLSSYKPRPRPDGLAENASGAAKFSNRTAIELAKLKPRSRPESTQSDAATSSQPTINAITASLTPEKRPEGFSEKFEIARQSKQTALATESASAPALGPVLPTRASVAKRATIKNAINLSKLNLIGVYGTSSKRRALLRLPTGRYVKVKVGDRVAGGQVSAIGNGSVNYVKAGRNTVLKVPN